MYFVAAFSYKCLVFVKRYIVQRYSNAKRLIVIDMQKRQPKFRANGEVENETHADNL